MWDYGLRIIVNIPQLCDFGCGLEWWAWRVCCHVLCVYVCVSRIDFPHILNYFLSVCALYKGSVVEWKDNLWFWVVSSLSIPRINRVGDSQVSLSVSKSDIFRWNPALGSITFLVLTEIWNPELMKEEGYIHAGASDNDYLKPLVIYVFSAYCSHQNGLSTPTQFWRAVSRHQGRTIIVFFASKGLTLHESAHLYLTCALCTANFLPISINLFHLPLAQ